MEAFRTKMKQNCNFLPRLLFRYLGISSYPNESVLYKIYSLITMTFTFLYPWSNLHVMLHNLDDFDIIINSLFNFIGGIIAVLKIMVIFYNKRNFQGICDKLEKLQREGNTEQWSQTEVYNTNKKVLITMIFFYVSLLYFHAGTMIERIANNDKPEEWRVPISDVSVINKTYSPNFEIAWTYQVIAVSVISSAFCFSDFLIAAIVVDMTVQFKILRKIVKRTLRSNSGTVSEKEDTTGERSWTYLQTIIKKITTHHLFLIDLVDHIEKVCSPLVFLDVIGNLCMICTSVYYASVLPLLDFKAMQSYLEAGMIIAALFLVCYCGTEISIASESIATACYEMDFVGTDIRFQKSLSMIIMRCQKPIKLTVGNFTGLSITVFVWILRSSYTYLMVLRKSNTYKKHE